MADPLSITYLAEMLGVPAWAFILVLIWSLFWKAIALWKSARKSQPIWFIIVLLFNTIGILDILYIFLFSEIKFSKKVSKRSKRKR